MYYFLSGVQDLMFRMYNQVIIRVKQLNFIQVIKYFVLMVEVVVWGGGCIFLVVKILHMQIVLLS